MSSSPNVGLGNPQLKLVDSVQTAGEFLTWLSQKRPHNAVAVDIETGALPGGPKEDALNPWRGQIRLAQVGDGETGWAIPWDEWKGVFYQGMKPYDGTLVFHNIAFESRWFDIHSTWDLPWYASDDTMLMSQIITPNSTAALKKLAAQLVDQRAVAMQSQLDEGMTKNGWDWGTVPVNYQPYWLYGALDTVLTMKIWEQFREKCGPGGIYSEPYELEMNTRRIVTRMELNGARVDLEYSQRKLDELEAYTEQVKKWMRDNYKGVSITSNVQLVGLFTDLGADFSEFTPKGLPSVNQDQLDKFEITGNDEIKYIAKQITNQRKAAKLASSYFANFLTKNENGFVHPSVMTMGARTGRMSIKDPALQTLPSGDPVVRRAFVPKEDGWGIISSDLDQVEFRIAANLSRDASLIELFKEADRTGGDVFTQIMRQIYQDDSLQKSDPRRRLVKGTVYGKLFGAGVDKMAMTSGVVTSVMKEVVDSFDSNYPGIRQLQKEIEYTGSQRVEREGVGYVTTRTGRRLPCDDERVYSLTNYLIQGTAAEVFKQNLVKLDQQDLTEYLIVPVHDEIVLQAPNSEAEEVMRVVQDCMTTSEGWDVPLTSGVEGPFETWGHKYDEQH